MLSSIGLPGTNGFVGEFLVLLGAFKHSVWWAVFAATGVILSACYMLWMFQRVVFGPVTHEENRKLTDLSLRERLVFAPLLRAHLLDGRRCRSRSSTACSRRSTARSQPSPSRARRMAALPSGATVRIADRAAPAAGRDGR